jgi:hypothetical protein
MFTCTVCQSKESREQLTEEIFQIDGKYVLVDRITEKVRSLVHGQARPVKSIALEVFEFA